MSGQGTDRYGLFSSKNRGKAGDNDKLSGEEVQRKGRGNRAGYSQADSNDKSRYEKSSIRETDSQASRLLEENETPNKLYVDVTSDKIKMTEVWKQGLPMMR